MLSYLTDKGKIVYLKFINKNTNCPFVGLNTADIVNCIFPFCSNGSTVLIKTSSIVLHLSSYCLDVADGLTANPHQIFSNGNCSGKLDVFLYKCLSQ